MLIPTWFLYVGGFSMLLLGVLQIQQRPRDPAAGLYARFINLGTLWSLVCISVGLGLLLMALGYWTPFDRAPAAPPPRHRSR